MYKYDAYIWIVFYVFDLLFCVQWLFGIVLGVALLGKVGRKVRWWNQVQSPAHVLPACKANEIWFNDSVGWKLLF